MSSRLQPLLEHYADLERKLARVPEPGALLARWQTEVGQGANPEQWSAHSVQINDRAELIRQWLLLLRQHLRAQEWLDSAFDAAIAPYWSLLAVECDSDLQLMQAASHPVWLVFEQLLIVGRSFQPAATGNDFLMVLSARMQQLAQQIFQPGSNPNAKQLLHEELHGIQELLQRLRDQQQQSDRVLLNKEMLAVRSTHVHSAVSRALRHAMLGKQVTERILCFVDQVWRKYLSVIYLRSGMETPEWGQALDDIDTLIWLEHSASVDEVEAALNADVAALLARLAAAKKSVRGVDGDVDNFINWFAERMAERVNGGSGAVDFGFGSSDAGVDAARPSIDPDALQDENELVEALRSLLPNDAVRLRTFEGWKRARIVEVDLAHDLILIADCYGLRLAAMGRRELAAAIRAEKVQLLPRGSLYTSSETEIEQFLQQVCAHWQQIYLAQLSDEKRRQEAIALHALEERRKQDAERRAQAMREAQERERRQNMEREAQGKATRLRAGAVVQIVNDDGKLRPAFLAMVSSASAEYIFVDRNGQRLAAWSQAQLLDAIMQERIVILESGSALDATLSGMVKERRQFLKVDEL